jgi:hypothetical protein
MKGRTEALTRSVGMRQISVARRNVLERHDEAVSKP